MNLIEIQSLGKQYQHGFLALKDLNLSIRENELISIIGPFGCGKSTLLELIGGIREQYSGTIKIKGQNPQQARLERKIGYVFQQPTLLPWRNVIQNVTLPQEIAGIEDNQKAYRLLETVGLSNCGKKKVQELSGGMQQLVSIVRSLILDPDILLLDEPFSSIDEVHKLRMCFYLSKIHQQTKKTTILVTHSISEAVYLSDRVVVMTPNPGKIKKIFNIHLFNREQKILFSKEFLSYVRIIRKELFYE